MDIYSILASKPHNSHYLNKYITFIQKCQLKNTNYNGNIEKHHICPKANDMFPEYKSFLIYPWNKAFLTHRQHFIAHILLWKTYPKSYSCVDAIWGMKCRRKTHMNSRIYEKLRVEAIKNISDRMKNKFLVYDENDPDKLFYISKEDSEYKSGKYKQAKIGYCRPGREFSIEHKISLSKAAKGKKKSKEHVEKMKQTFAEKGITKGKNHPRHKYFYTTPEGIFDSPAALEHIGITLTKMKSWCIACNRIILKSVYEKNSYLNKKFDKDIIGKTYKDIGFSVIVKD